MESNINAQPIFLLIFDPKGKIIPVDVTKTLCSINPTLSEPPEPLIKPEKK